MSVVLIICFTKRTAICTWHAFVLQSHTHRQNTSQRSLEKNFYSLSNLQTPHSSPFSRYSVFLIINKCFHCISISGLYRINSLTIKFPNALVLSISMQQHQLGYFLPIMFIKNGCNQSLIPIFSTHQICHLHTFHALNLFT